MSDDANAPDDLVYTPKQVSERLAIGTPMLRRYAASYERVFGELNRDSRDGRLYSETDVRRIEAARALVSDGPYASIDDALEHLQRGDESVDQTLTKAAEPTFEEQMMNALGRLLASTATREQVEALHRDALKQLPAAAETESLKAENETLKAELEEMREKLEQAQRPWWRRLRGD